MRFQSGRGGDDDGLELEADPEAGQDPFHVAAAGVQATPSSWPCLAGRDPDRAAGHLQLARCEVPLRGRPLAVADGHSGEQAVGKDQAPAARRAQPLEHLDQRPSLARNPKHRGRGRSMSARLACAVRMRTFNSGWLRHQLGPWCRCRPGPAGAHPSAPRPVAAARRPRMPRRVLRVADALHVRLRVQGPGQELGEGPVVVDDQHLVRSTGTACRSSSMGSGPSSITVLVIRFPRVWAVVHSTDHVAPPATTGPSPPTAIVNTTLLQVWSRSLWSGHRNAVDSPFGRTQPGLGPQRSNDLAGRHRVFGQRSSQERGPRPGHCATRHRRPGKSAGGSAAACASHCFTLHADARNVNPPSRVGSPARVKQSTATRPAASVAMPRFQCVGWTMSPTSVSPGAMPSQPAPIGSSSTRPWRSSLSLSKTGPGPEAVLLPPLDPPVQLTFNQPTRFGLVVRTSEDLRAVANLVVEVEVRFARRAKHETLTHELHTIHATARTAAA